VPVLRVDHIESQGLLPGMRQVAQASVEGLNPNKTALGIDTSMRRDGVWKEIAGILFAGNIFIAIPRIPIVPTCAETVPRAAVTPISERDIAQVSNCEQNSPLVGWQNSCSRNLNISCSHTVIFFRLWGGSY
jgi:hypothetical protein